MKFVIHTVYTLLITHLAFYHPIRRDFTYFKLRVQTILCMQLKTVNSFINLRECIKFVFLWLNYTLLMKAPCYLNCKYKFPYTHLLLSNWLKPNSSCMKRHRWKEMKNCGFDIHLGEGSTGQSRSIAVTWYYFLPA